MKTQKLKVRKIGNSVGITLPSDWGIEIGTRYEAHYMLNGSIILTYRLANSYCCEVNKDKVSSKKSKSKVHHHDQEISSPYYMLDELCDHHTSVNVLPSKYYNSY